MDNPQPTREQIELRAYELYLQRGAQPEQDLADWFAAEQELTFQQESKQESQESMEIAEPTSGQKAKRGTAASATA